MADKPGTPVSEQSQRFYLRCQRDRGIKVRIAWCHHRFGSERIWQGGKDKAPAATCRRVAEAPDCGAIEMSRDGKQMRSFLFIDEYLEGTLGLMRSDFSGPG